MQLATIDREKLSPELQQSLANFEVNRDAYIALQNRYTEVMQENQRLTQKAAELEGQANRTDASWNCLLYTSPSPRDQRGSRMPSSA